MEFKLVSLSADAISGNVALSLQVLNAAGFPQSTLTLQFPSTINPGETVEAFAKRVDGEARAALQAAANYSGSRTAE